MAHPAPPPEWLAADTPAAPGDVTDNGPVSVVRWEADSCLNRPAETAAGVLDRLDQDARDFARNAKAPNTQRAYQSDWTAFRAWCAGVGLTPLPAAPETVARYLTAQAGTLKTSTLRRRLSSISQAHQMATLETPVRAAAVRLVWQGICREYGTAEEAKTAAVTEDVRRMVAALPASTLGTRDRALLLIGFAGAFRRSELVSLDRAGCELKKAGLILTLRRSKTDQAGAGTELGIPYGDHDATCPVRAWKAWTRVLDTAGLTEGPLFRRIDRHGHILGPLGDRAVALVVQRQAAACGLDPARYAGHSLRSGLATAAAEAGVEERAIMRATRHRSTKMVRRYIQAGSLFRDNAAGKVGL